MHKMVKPSDSSEIPEVKKKKLSELSEDMRTVDLILRQSEDRQRMLLRAMHRARELRERLPAAPLGLRRRRAPWRPVERCLAELAQLEALVGPPMVPRAIHGRRDRVNSPD